MNMNSVLSVLGIIVLVGLYLMMRPRSLQTVIKPVLPGPTKAVLPPAPSESVRVLTMIDEIKMVMILSRLYGHPCSQHTAKSIYRIMRQRGMKFRFDVKNVQSILNQESRQGKFSMSRPQAGSARQRRNRTKYTLACN